MKKIILYLSIFTLIFCVTGCGNKKENNKDINNNNIKGNQYVSETEKYEVFEKMANNLLSQGMMEKQTFFYLVYDGSLKSEILKEDVEKLAEKYKYTIYLYDYEENLEKLKEQYKEQIETEENNFYKKYCKLIEISSDELNQYDLKDLIKQSDNTYFRYKCSNEIAKENNPDYEYNEETEEPYFSCVLCEQLKQEILDNISSNNSTNLIFIRNGVISGETGDYIEDKYFYMTNSEKKEYRANAFKALEEWFKTSIE